MSLFLRGRFMNLGATALVLLGALGSQGCSVEAPPLGDEPLATDSQPLLTTPAWTQVASLSTERAQATAVRLVSGKVLVAGGFGNGASLATAAVYDPTNNTSTAWTATAPMTNGRYTHAAVLLPNGRVLVVGGNSNAPASAEIYDPASNNWAAAASMSHGRIELTATLLGNGKVLVVSDWDAELYDPTGNSWSPAGALNSFRRRHTATLLPSGKVLVAGGYLSANPLATAEVYDPQTNSWSSVVSMASARGSHTATLLPNGRVLVAGGESNSAAELYDPGLNQWFPAGNMTLPHGGHTAVLVNGKVLVTGGMSSGTPNIDTTNLYDPVLNTWTTGAYLNAPHGQHTAVVLKNGKVLVMGGLFQTVTESLATTDAFLGSVLGNTVAQGSTCGASNAVRASCGSSNAPERGYSWVAPYTGRFTFTTAGSTFNTVLQVMDVNTGAVLGCNDDANSTVQSSVTVDLVGGQPLSLFVDGYSTGCGNFFLNIQPQACNWTTWYNRDSQGGSGDYELRADMVPAVCSNPVAVDCKTTSGLDWTQTGEVTFCSLSDGLACVNANQRDGYCLDYMVRFCCP